LGKMALLTPFKLQWICQLRNMDDARKYLHRLLMERRLLHFRLG
jgi:hypothetical protein